MVDNTQSEMVSPTEALTWWKKNKNKVYAAILVVVGLLGGNVDRIPEAISSVLPTDIEVPAELTKRIDKHEFEINSVKERLDRLDDRVDNLDTRLSRNRIPVQ